MPYRFLLVINLILGATFLKSVYMRVKRQVEYEFWGNGWILLCDSLAGVYMLYFRDKYPHSLGVGLLLLPLMYSLVYKNMGYASSAVTVTGVFLYIAFAIKAAILVFPPC